MAAFVGDDKAKLALDRQLQRVEATEDNVEATHLPKMLNFLMGAVTLYVPDKAKREELKSQLQAIA